mmetsp:Transcript_6239/g.16088  ORF Transcript_6239/g.16088 Transcript_6239/m.16088 type:complete len:269 (+) Transcript_6239:295-1101(+)
MVHCAHQAVVWQVGLTVGTVDEDKAGPFGHFRRHLIGIDHGPSEPRVGVEGLFVMNVSAVLEKEVRRDESTDPNLWSALWRSTLNVEFNASPLVACVVRRRWLAWGMREALELDLDIGLPLLQLLPCHDQDRDTRKLSLLHPQACCCKSWRVGCVLCVVAVGLAVLNIALVLPKHRVLEAGSLERRKKVGLRLERCGGVIVLHSSQVHPHQRKNLRQVILMDVSDHAVLVVKVGPALTALFLGHDDLDGCYVLVGQQRIHGRRRQTIA